MIFQNIQVSFLPCQAISQVRFQQQKYEHVFIRAVWDMSFTHCISSLLKPLLIQAKSRKLATMLKMLNIFHHKTIFCFYTGQLALKLWFHMSTICFRWETYSFLGWNKKKIYRVHSLLSSQHTNCFGFTYYAYKLHLLKHGYEIQERFVFVKEAILYSTQQMKPLKVTVLQIPGI